MLTVIVIITRKWEIIIDLDVICPRSENRPAIQQAGNRDLDLLIPSIGFSFEHFVGTNKCILNIFERNSHCWRYFKGPTSIKSMNAIVLLMSELAWRTQMLSACNLKHKWWLCIQELSILKTPWKYFSTSLFWQVKMTQV